ncbi:hypothetical protein UFOVP1537_41 [uncultured Caudovirales phage]|uniref:Uncharacterized protein n=2 Tax=root TaxID=1 RepID=A0A6J5Q6Q9_9CAUD|nr:hypothetical protein UFOVP825_6 [uncultured Caudovirales phage]CAB4171307.1 hypothetical protein UFOVP915_41 [uncultured Caudovirales phage]CAB4177188.1 hypothetical protein UFOVP1000_5 [uncultured Caudovirales phage]CAB4183042.1 hypothetical protein UFOVP1092_33 [uncultured Caudovirales phage]CAB4187618.1 hypothetical protein UFOVP1152_37 [uncultured Caudovirales phage]
MRVSSLIATNVEAAVKDILQVINGKIDLADNVFCCIVTATAHATPNTEFSVTHNLQRIPTIYIVNIDRSGIVYDSSRSTWTAQTIKLKCSVASAVLHLVIF